MAGHSYTYHIREVAGEDEMVEYDNHVEDVTVNVTDDGRGNLSGEVTYDADGAVFENTRRKEVVMPGTGMTPSFIIVVFGAVALGVGALVVRRRRQQA